MTPSRHDPRHRVKTDVTGHGPPLVLVPGGLTGWNSWQAHAEKLAPDWRVVRTQLLSVDLGLRGEPLPSDYSLRMESYGLLHALDELEVEEANLVGWSYGGGIALNVALDNPDRVRSLTLVEPDADWVLRAFDRYGVDAQAFNEGMRAYAMADVSEAQLERFLIDIGVVPTGVDARSLPRWPVWVEHRQSLRIGDTPTRHEDDVARLRTFHRPVLLFKGEGSPAFMRETVDLLAQELPNARVEELPGGHALPLVSMDRFLEILKAFLGEHQDG